MNTTIRAMTGLALLFTTGASAQDCTWTPLAGLGEVPGPQGEYHRTVYAPGQGVLLYGRLFSEEAAETWLWNGSEWSFLTDQGPDVAGPAMAWDTARNTAVLFGGDTGLSDASDETWIFDGAWTNLGTLPGPGARLYPAAAFVPRLPLPPPPPARPEDQALRRFHDEEMQGPGGGDDERAAPIPSLTCPDTP